MATGIATISFGTTPVQEGTIAVTGQAAILTTSYIEAFIMADDTTVDNDATSHDFAAVSFRLTCKTLIAGTGFTIKVTTIAGGCTGDFKIRWVWI